MHDGSYRSASGLDEGNGRGSKMQACRGSCSNCRGKIRLHQQADARRVRRACDQMSSSAHSNADANCRVTGAPALSAVSRAMNLDDA